MPKVSTKLSRILILILVVAVAARLAWVLLVPTEPVSDFLAFDHLAKSLVSGTGFSMGGGEPTTYRLPGYPFFLASLYAVTGQSWLTARLANVALGVLTCLLTYAIASRLFNRRVALIAALLVALFPSHILYANILATENLFIPLVLALLLALTLSNQDQKLHTKWLTLAGILLGLGALTRPALLLFPIVWGGLLLLQRLPFRRVFAALVVIGLVAVAIILPWTVRNALVTGEFIPIASEGGITFLAGHNQMALTGPYSLKSPEFDELYSEPRSEAETDAYAYQLAFRFIRQNPGTELKLLVHKFRYFFQDDVSGVSWNATMALNDIPARFNTPLIVITQLYYIVVLALALVSLVLQRKVAPDRGYLILIAFFLYWTAIHLAFYGKDRFRLPLMPILAIFAAVTLTYIWFYRPSQLKNSTVVTESPTETH